MSSKIYFTDKAKRHWSWWLIRTFTFPLLLLPKSISNPIVAKLLLKPGKRINQNLPDGISQEFVDTPHGKIAIYRTGEGPIVLLSHGWSGAANQLFELMQNIASNGFQAVAFDHIAHGDSDGKQANLFVFIKITRHIIQLCEQQGEIAAIISHSMGATATVNALTRSYPTLLIAPVFEFSNALFSKVEQSGLPRRLLENLLASLESRYQMIFNDCDPKQHLSQHAAMINIIHDEADRFSPIEESINVVNQHPQISLNKTQNLGHGRIISSLQTRQLFLNMMQENSTHTQQFTAST